MTSELGDDVFGLSPLPDFEDVLSPAHLSRKALWIRAAARWPRRGELMRVEQTGVRRRRTPVEVPPAAGGGWRKKRRTPGEELPEELPAAEDEALRAFGMAKPRERPVSEEF